ncbi:MAG TPA: YciI family protein [Gemmatimonadaceae bacterium]|nr:YciI family protein [Gemmatimonadaceae bacterium]
MKYMVLIYNDGELLDAMPKETFNEEMRGCLAKADALRSEGRLFDSQMLEGPQTARTLRTRKNKMTVTDGPFTETKEFLAGFNLIEADNIDDAVRIAAQFPWAKVGSIEVRPVRDIADVRKRVGAVDAAAHR